MEKYTESLGGTCCLNEPASARCKQHNRNAVAALVAQVFAELMRSLNQCLPLCGVGGDLSRLSFSHGAGKDFIAPCTLPYVVPWFCFGARVQFCSRNTV